MPFHLLKNKKTNYVIIETKAEKPWLPERLKLTSIKKKHSLLNKVDLKYQQASFTNESEIEVVGSKYD